MARKRRRAASSRPRARRRAVRGGRKTVRRRRRSGGARLNIMETVTRVAVAGAGGVAGYSVISSLATKFAPGTVGNTRSALLIGGAVAAALGAAKMLPRQPIVRDALLGAAAFGVADALYARVNTPIYKAITGIDLNAAPSQATLAAAGPLRLAKAMAAEWPKRKLGLS